MGKFRALFGWSSFRTSSSAVPAQIGRHHKRFLRSRVVGLLGGCALALILGCLSPQAKGESVSTIFHPSRELPGTVYGTAATASTGGDPSGTGTCLQFDTDNGQSGLLVLDELDSGREVQSFAVGWLNALLDSSPGASHNDSINVGMDGPSPLRAIELTSFSHSGRNP
jgi:hypothetical protein